jgi:Xaa-Pro aminopeptidase
MIAPALRKMSRIACSTVVGLSLAWLSVGRCDGPATRLPAAFTPEEFAGRRAAVLKAIGNDLAILCGADPMDTWRPFRQHNDFYYLTGVEVPHVVLLLDGAAQKSTLFVPPSGRRRAESGKSEDRWMGIEQVEATDKLAGTLKELAKGRQRIHVPRFPGEGNAQSRDLPRGGKRAFPFDRRPTRAEDFRNAVKELVGDLEIADLERVTDPLRRVKSPAEIAVMRQAGRIGAEAIAEAIRRTRPGIIEGELAGVCEMVYARHGSYASAWTCIVASGPNIMDFHYMANSRRLETGDVVLLDAGPDYRYYTSDITRVWPVRGPYPPRYRELYDKLLAVHQATVAAVRPGATIAELNRVMMAEAAKQGIGPNVIPQPGHYTGMAPHDVGGRNDKFVPGVVFNVEPLLIVPNEQIHLRFEDTVLCTAGDPEVFTPLDVLPWEADKLIEMRDGKPK